MMIMRLRDTKSVNCRCSSAATSGVLSMALELKWNFKVTAGSVGGARASAGYAK